MFTDEQKAWMLEAERRGVLSEQQKTYLSEARSRGLIETLPAPDGGVSDSEGSWLKQNVFNKPEPFSGGLLPISRKEMGGPVEFDSDAGFLGSIKRAVQLPKQVLDGEVNPMSPQGMERTLEAATVMTPMGVASRGAAGVLAPKSSYKTIPKKAPTRAALKDATGKGYDSARALGAEYTPQSISTWADDMVRKLDSEGRISETYQEVHALLNKLRNPDPDAVSVSLESVDALYRELGRLAQSPEASKASTASLVQKGLDDYFGSLDPSALVAGTATPEKAAKILREARGNAAAGFRSDDVTRREYFSNLETKAANSGRNTDNKIRQTLVSLLKNRKESGSLTKTETKAIEDIINGKRPKNAARYLSNLLGAGGGMGQSLMSAGSGVAGASAFGPYGAALAMLPPVIGGSARGIANTMSKRELKALDDLIRSRSPLAESMPGGKPLYQPGLLQGAGETAIKGLLAPKPKKGVDLGWI